MILETNFQEVKEKCNIHKYIHIHKPSDTHISLRGERESGRDTHGKGFITGNWLMQL
jgi:hypothetical protein